jgi:hypothetical protein
MVGMGFTLMGLDRIGKTGGPHENRKNARKGKPPPSYSFLEIIALAGILMPCRGIPKAKRTGIPLGRIGKPQKGIPKKYF